MDSHSQFNKNLVQLQLSTNICMFNIWEKQYGWVENIQNITQQVHRLTPCHLA